MSGGRPILVLVPLLVGVAAAAATGASSGAAFLASHTINKANAFSTTDQQRIRPPFSLSHATTNRSTIGQRPSHTEAAVHRPRHRKRSQLWMEPTDTTDENTQVIKQTSGASSDFVDNDDVSEAPSLIRDLDESASPPPTVNGKEAPAASTRGLTKLIEKIHQYCPDADDDMISRAYCFAENAHKDQKRKSGEPYFIHPLNVANIIANMKLDVPAVVTGLLHDTVEDCDSVCLDDIRKEFGEEVASLVDGVTKIGRIKFHSRQEAQAENYRKMIVAMAHDIRVILVKLADRTHNIRTLQHMTPKKQKEKAMETIDIFAPLAHRLGMHRIKEELEDTCLKYLEPKTYGELESMVAAGKEERQRYINKVIIILEQILVNGGIGHDSTKVSGRPKSYYSIYEKMKSQNLTFDSIQDLTAFRIIVDDISQCYQALGAVHMHFKPVPGRFKDYVALPKANGYQSLHTTVIGPDAKRIEIQIRTKEMHEMAENGVSSHWIYKGGNTAGSAEEAERFRWLKQLVEWVQEMNDPSEFIDSVKEDLFEKEVFVFSPEGELFALAKGSSVLDFAYRVHSDLGNTCVGGKINGRMVPMRHKVQNGDTVEVLTSTDQFPRREWLNFVRTSKAQARIRQWLKQEQRSESIALGRELLDKELRKQASLRQIDASKACRTRLSRVLSLFDMRDEDYLLSAIGYGQISVTSVVDEVLGVSSNQGLEGKGLSKDEQSDAATLQLIEEKASQQRASASSTPAKNKNDDGILVGGERNLMIDFCKNCNPLMGEDIKGAITLGRGIKIHRTGCRYLLLQPEERRLDASWDTSSVSKPSRPVQLDVVCEDQAGILASMSRAISAQKFDIRSVNLRKLANNRGLAKFEVMLSTVEDLERVMMQLQQEKGVISVERR